MPEMLMSPDHCAVPDNSSAIQHECRADDFVKLCIANDALQFGKFELKSGRTSPYFFNAGAFYQADALAQLARHYAELINENIKGNITLFGPAYKGIPLAVATAMALHHYHNRDVACAFNRKETKTHGEGGNLIGAPLRGNVVIIDDVITAGTAIGESMDIINEAGANVVAVIIALDRAETADGNRSAVEKVEETHRVKVHARINLDDLIAHLQTEPTAEFVKHAAELRDYRERYGVRGRNFNGHANGGVNGSGYINGNGRANGSGHVNRNGSTNGSVYVNGNGKGNGNGHAYTNGARTK